MKVLSMAVIATAAQADKMTPVQKALQMLEGMIKTCDTARYEEKKQYQKYDMFCVSTGEEKSKAIAEADDKIETLQAHILKFDSEVARLAAEISAHKGEITGWNGDMDAAKTVRTTEEKDYATAHTDLSESVQALTKAIGVLQAQNFDRKGVSLLQKTVVALAARAPKESRALMAFLQRSAEDPNVKLVQEENDLTFKVPEVPTSSYEFKSGGIIEMLEGLLDEFRKEVVNHEKEEVARNHAFTTLLQDLTDSIAAGEKSIESKTALEAQNQENSNEANSDLSQTQTTRADDATFLADMTATCNQKASDFASRQKLRDEEIQALEKAVEILSSSAVSGNADKHLPASSALQLKKRATVLAQLRASSWQEPSRMQRVEEFLAEASTRIGSPTLSALALKAQKDPFEKVKRLIEELIKRLMQEATNEAEHKGWCDKELGTNAHTRKSRTEAIDMLHGEIDKLSADIAKLNKDLGAHAAAVAQLEADVASATELRENEKAENEAAIQDAKDGQTAMAEVIKVLNDFYGEAAKATALVQKSKQQPVAPEVFGDEAYTGMQAASGGVLGMMEVINSDFARLEQDTQASELAATAEYDKFMEDSAIDKAAKEKDIQFWTGEEQNKQIQLTDKQVALEDAQKILDQALQEFEALKPACLGDGMSYEERVQRREDELQALNQAYQILTDMGPSL